MHLNLSWGGKIPDRARAEAAARGVQLLSGRAFAALFPDARIERERVLGLTKSFTAVGGFEAP
jgi:hypothetical protein